MKKKIAILGSTGSIGKTLFNILKKDKKNFEIVLLTADKNYKDLLKQAKVFDVKNIIPAKFNRLVMFPGNCLHGGYIEDYSKYSGDNWRYSQVTFFHPQPHNKRR